MRLCLSWESEALLLKQFLSPIAFTNSIEWGYRRCSERDNMVEPPTGEFSDVYAEPYRADSDESTA